jgi:quinol monooxygenase YgiN
MTLIIAGTLTIDPSKTDDAMVAMVEMMKATHAEDGNLAYVFSVDPIEAGLIHLFEKWESADALAAHSKAPHMGTFQAAMGGFGVTGADIKKYEIASEGPLR